MYGDTLPLPAQVQLAGAGWILRLDGPGMSVVRPEVTASFVFPVETGMLLDVRVTVRFTDDTELHWEIDHDLRLRKRRRRDW